jgi:hypothetical protein
VIAAHYRARRTRGVPSCCRAAPYETAPSFKSGFSPLHCLGRRRRPMIIGIHAVWVDSPRELQEPHSTMDPFTSVRAPAVSTLATASRGKTHRWLQKQGARARRTPGRVSLGYATPIGRSLGRERPD